VGINRDYLRDGTGAWGDLKIGTCSTKIVKHTVKPLVTLTMESIGKKVTFEVTANDNQPSISELNGIPLLDLV
jgi:hypothetical protein